FDKDNIKVIENKLTAAHGQFERWRKLPINSRSEFLEKLANVLAPEREHLATLLTQEIGKPIAQSRQEIKKCEDLCRFYHETADQFLSPRQIETENSMNEIVYDPL